MKLKKNRMILERFCDKLLELPKFPKKNFEFSFRGVQIKEFKCIKKFKFNISVFDPVNQPCTSKMARQFDQDPLFVASAQWQGSHSNKDPLQQAETDWNTGTSHFNIFKQ